MLSVPMFNMVGKSTGTVELDPEVLGGRVRAVLIKQAIVAFLNHRSQGSARTKGRADVVGSTRKLYRQKGTGNARAGNIRTPIRRGGGRTFARRGPRRDLQLPKKMRRLATDSAILAKIIAEDTIIIEDLACPQVKTKALATMFSALGIKRGCLIATDVRNQNLYLSGRNIPGTDFRIVDDLNAYEVMRRPKLVFTKAAFEHLTSTRSKSAKSDTVKAAKE